jgi:YspA, cpYpsA-related SLOG family
MRILVCGGRDFHDSALVYRTLDCWCRKAVVDAVIDGNAPGADRIAGYWARKHRIKNIKFPADWKAHGKAAGPIRNQRMIDEGKPDVVVAFPGGKGTADMIRRARAAHIETIVVQSPDQNSTGSAAGTGNGR